MDGTANSKAASMRQTVLATLACMVLQLCGCAGAPAATAGPTQASAPLAGGNPDPEAVLDRLTWGATSADFDLMQSMGSAGWVEVQLRASAPGQVPAAVARQIDELSGGREGLPELVYRLETQRHAADALADEDARKAAQHDVQVELNRLARSAALCQLLRELYSPNQLQEQLAWFWFNHFNVHQNKHLLRAMVGDYAQQLRVRALGRFGDLLAASARHPAMLAYLDNAQNAAGHINENYARELLELHTMGVDGGYTQKDVQELARVLTGFGIYHGDPARTEPPRLRREIADLYVRNGLFEFNPARHDFGDKTVLGHVIHGRGAVELDEALDLLVHQRATARHVSGQLARFLVGDAPPPQLVEAMSDTFQYTDGDIAAVLRTALHSDAFAASLHRQFKDPQHYVVSAVRRAYDGKPIANAGPMLNWLRRMGEAPFEHATPDGYPLAESAWAGPGQMALRFEIAKAIGSGSAGLFRTEGDNPADRPAFPQLASALYYRSTQQRLGPATRAALDQAATPQEWNLLLLSSPEFMMR